MYAALRAIDRSVEQIKRELDTLILSTPTGPVREKLTEANIHLIAMTQAVDAACRISHAGDKR